MKLTIVNDLGPTGVQAHKAGCADLKKHRHFDSFTAAYGSKAEATADYNVDFEDDDAWTIDWSPCTRGIAAS